MTVLKAALKWAGEGIPVFPCNSRKRPMTSDGFYSASTDVDTVTAMFKDQGAGTLIGARMGQECGLFAVDLDIYKPGAAGESAKQYMADLLARGLLPDTQRHKTMNGGLHLIYSSSTDWPNCAPTDGVEIKGEGGYIILPPSRGYSIEDDAGFAEAPTALIEVLIKSRSSHRAQTTTDLKANVASAKDFHNSLASLAAKLFRRGTAPEKVMDALLGALQGSVAAATQHARHDRWRTLIDDSDGELSRIVNSGRSKYDPSASTENAQDSVNTDLLAKFAAASDGMFAAPPSPHEGKEEKPAIDYGDSWPFEGDGYFAHEHIDVSSQKFNIYPVYAENESVIIAADPKAGKTAISLRLAFALACGQDFGTTFKVSEARGVLYFALEGTRAIKLRLEAEKRRQTEEGIVLPDNIPLFVVERTPNVLRHQEDLAAKIIAADKWYKKESGKQLGLVVLDTLTKAMPGADQNSVDDTSKLFEITDMLRRGGVVATVVFVHHTGKDGKTRGSSNIEAEVDVVLKVKKQEDNTSTMYVHMARSIEDGQQFHFRLKGYSLGKTEQGIEQSAPYVELIEGPTQTSNDVSDAARRAHTIKPILEVLFSMSIGEHTLRSCIAELKKAGIMAGRGAKSDALKLLALVFDRTDSVVYRNHTITLKRDDQEQPVAITVSTITSPS